MEKQQTQTYNKGKAMRNKKRKTTKAEAKQNNVKLFETQEIEANNDIKVYEVDNEIVTEVTESDTQKECNNCKSENMQLQNLYDEVKESLKHINRFEEHLKNIDDDIKVLKENDVAKSKILDSIDDLYSHNIKTIETETNEVLEKIQNKITNFNNEVKQGTQALKEALELQTDLLKRIETLENTLDDIREKARESFTLVAERIESNSSDIKSLKLENSNLKEEINNLKVQLSTNQDKSLWQIIKSKM